MLRRRQRGNPGAADPRRGAGPAPHRLARACGELADRSGLRARPAVRARGMDGDPDLQYRQLRGERLAADHPSRRAERADRQGLQGDHRTDRRAERDEECGRATGQQGPDQARLAAVGRLWSDRQRRQQLSSTPPSPRSSPALRFRSCGSRATGSCTSSSCSPWKARRAPSPCPTGRWWLAWARSSTRSSTTSPPAA